MRAISLVVVHGGTAYVYEPIHVDTRVIDLDNLEAGDPAVKLPSGVGFEELVKQAGLELGTQVTFEKEHHEDVENPGS